MKTLDAMTIFRSDLRIAIDVTFLQDQFAARGIGRYGKEVVRRMLTGSQAGGTEELEQIEFHLIGFGELDENLGLLFADVSGGRERQEQEARLAKANIYFHSLGSRRKSSPLSNILLYHFRLKPLINKLQPDCFFAAHFERGIPSQWAVVPIHDIIPLVTGSYSGQGAIVNFLKGLYYKYILSTASKVHYPVASSRHTGEDMARYLGYTTQEISVVYLGVSDIFRDTGEGESRVVEAGSPYLVYDSGLERNKNADFLLRVFAVLKERLPGPAGLQLVVTGGDFREGLPANPRAQAFLELARELEVEERIVATGRLSDQELAETVKNAYAYINLSSYEGFGLGPVQAMSAGVFTIVADAPPFPEIVADGALVVPISDPEATAELIADTLGPEERRKQVVDRGLERSKLFSWDHTYKETWKLVLKTAHEHKQAKES